MVLLPAKSIIFKMEMLLKSLFTICETDFLIFTTFYKQFIDFNFTYFGTEDLRK